MPVQPELFPPKPGDYATETAWFEALLDLRKEWVTAAEVLAAIGRPATDDNKRWVRNLARNSKHVLSGPGSPGYRHIKHSNIGECQHYRDAQISQGKEMIRNGIKISRAAHALFG